MNGFDQPDWLVPPVGERDHSQGCETAAVTLVEYGDYQCPDCAQFCFVFRDFQHQFGNQLRFVFRHFPQPDIHPRAFPAAEAAEAAAAQGKFWEMHHYLFEHQQALADADLVEYAIQLDLGIAQFLQAMSGHVYAERVQEDVESGRMNGVTGTPTFFIKVRHQGTQNLEPLLLAILASTPQ